MVFACYKFIMVASGVILCVCVVEEVAFGHLVGYVFIALGFDCIVGVVRFG